MLTRTRLVVTEEPDPLATVTIRTVSSLMTVQSLIDRIDGVLATSEPTTVDLLMEAEMNRTRLQKEAEPLTLAPPSGLGPRRAPQAESAASQSAHLDRCLNELQDWLGIGLVDVCPAAGISRATVYAWRARNSEPRPGTIGGILRLHGLVSAAVRAVGTARTREWFHAGDPSPLLRLTMAHGDPGTMTALGRELRRALTGPVLPPPNRLLAATLDDSPARPLA